MRPEVQRDLDDSARAFNKVVWPVIGAWLGGGDLVPVENHKDREMFDLHAGIDAWHLENNERQIRGIASRVQKYPLLLSSFTVRKSRRTGATTEFEKRLKAIRNPGDGWLFPAITVQAYVRGDELIGVGVIRTRDLYEFIANGRLRHDYDVMVNGEDGNEFFVVWWERLRRTNIRLRTTGEERLTDRSCDCAECVGQLTLEDAILGLSQQINRSEITIDEFDLFLEDLS